MLCSIGIWVFIVVGYVWCRRGGTGSSRGDVGLVGLGDDRGLDGLEVVGSRGW